MVHASSHNHIYPHWNITILSDQELHFYHYHISQRVSSPDPHSITHLHICHCFCLHLPIFSDISIFIALDFGSDHSHGNIWKLFQNHRLPNIGRASTILMNIVALILNLLYDCDNLNHSMYRQMGWTFKKLHKSIFPWIFCSNWWQFIEQFLSLTLYFF